MKTIVSKVDDLREILSLPSLGLSKPVCLFGLSLLLVALLHVESLAQNTPNKLNPLISSGNLDGIRAAVEADSTLLTKKLGNYQSPLLAAIQLKKAKVVKLLLELGADANVKSRYKRTALQEAIVRGDNGIVFDVLDKTKDVNQVDRNNSSALSYCIMYRGDNVELVDALISKGANIELANRNKQTPLISACYSNRPKIAARLLEAGANLSAVDNNKNTPLLAACMISGDLTKAMLDKGADPVVVNRQKQTALHLLCQSARRYGVGTIDKKGEQWVSNASKAVLEELLKKFDDVDMKDASGRTPLNMAVFASNLHLIGPLIDRGADPNHVDNTKIPMISVAAQNGSSEVVEKLIQSGAKLNVKDAVGDGPLHSAAKAGGMIFGPQLTTDGARYVETLKHLLAGKANPNAKNAEGQTPLEIAAKSDFLPAVELLVDKTEKPNFDLGDGSLLHWAAKNSLPKTTKHLVSTNSVDVNEKNSKGQTPLQVAAESGSEKLIKTLIESGSNVNHVDDDGTTALLIASSAGHAPVIRALIAAGADLNKTDLSGQSCLHLAAWGGHVDAVAELLSKSREAAKAKTSSGYTPLHAAAWNGHLPVAEKLLEAGVDLNVADSDGWTPLHKAAYRGHLEFVRWITVAGADRTIKNGVGMTALDVARSNKKAKVVELLGL